MVGKALAAARGSIKGPSDTQSVMSLTSVRTVDREKLREKARRLQMKENMRMTLCVRIQQTLKKSPQVADELAGEVLRLQKQHQQPLSDAELSKIVAQLCERRQQQRSIAAAATAVPPIDSASASPSWSSPPATMPGRQQPSSGRRSNPQLDRSARRSQGKNRSGSQGKRQPQADEENVYLTEAQLQQMATGFRLPPKVSPQKERGNGIWEEIVKFSSVEEQLEAHKKRERKERERMQLARKLEEQVQQRQQQTEAERKAADLYFQQSQQLLQDAEEEERRKAQSRVDRARQLTQIQDEQRRAKMQQRERERLAKKAHELKMAENLRLQNEAEQERDRAKKEAEKMRIQRVLEENQRDMARKAEQRRRDHEQEMQLAEQYIQMEQAKDDARRAQLEAMANNVKARMKLFGDTAKADMDAKAQEEEQRVRRYQDEYAHQQNEAERKKKEEAEKRNQDQQRQLKQQMQEKRAREEAARRDVNKQADLWRQERMSAERNERMQQAQRVARNQSQQELLRQQIRDKEQRSLQADQSPLEVQINAKLLDKIHQQTGQGNSVVTETQHRSRELQQQEREFLQSRQ